MKLTILLLSVSIAVLSSCTTAYKTGQTPDDVYFSPAQEREEYVESEKEDDRRYSDEYYEDRYLRMKVRNRTRWSDLDDWYYSDYRNRYNVYLGCCFCQTNWSPYSYWNTYHNPYYNNYVIIKDVRTPVYNKPRTFNLNAYNPPAINTRGDDDPKLYPSSTPPGNNTYTPNNNNSSGSRLRNIFRSNNQTSGSSNNSSSNSSSGSSSNSSGGSKPSSSGSTAPVRRF